MVKKAEPVYSQHVCEPKTYLAGTLDGLCDDDRIPHTGDPLTVWSYNTSPSDCFFLQTVYILKPKNCPLNILHLHHLLITHQIASKT